MKIKFKHGDRVELVKLPYDLGSRFFKIGATGTVVAINTNFEYGVKWDFYHSGMHNLVSALDYIDTFPDNILCEDGYGWWVPEDCIELLYDDKFEFKGSILDIL